jgi:hypothetical protein
VYVGICLLLRMMASPRKIAAVALGPPLRFSTGLAPLIVPVSVIPDAARWAHLYEIVSANFLFGFACGSVLERREPNSLVMKPAA